MQRGENCTTERVGRLVTQTAIVLLFLTHSLPHDVSAQSRRQENSPLLHFSPRNSNLKHQTWSVVQDKRGVLYVADEDGIKVFDGDIWTLIKTETGTTVRSLAVSASGVIYYGAQGEFGKISADDEGRFRAESLSATTGAGNRVFSDVWGTHVVHNTVFFQTRELVFVYDGEHIESWESSSGFHTSFIVDESFYVREINVGLLKYTSGSMYLLPGSEVFADSRIYLMDRLPDGNILIGTQEDGLFLYDAKSFVAFESELDNYQALHSDSRSTLRLYASDKIHDNAFAIATLGAGLVIIDDSGTILSSMRVKDGLPDDWVNAVVSDNNGSIWLALNNNGVAFIDLASTVIRYSSDNGIGGHINHISRIHGQLLISTGADLLSLKESSITRMGSENTTLFQKVDGIELPWSVHEFGNSVAAATDQGLVFLDQKYDNYELIKCTDEPTLTIVQEPVSNILLAGTKTGLKTVNRNENGCDLQSFEGIREEIWSIQSANDNQLWIGTRHQGAIRIDNINSPDSVASTFFYSPTDGLPSSNITVSSVGGEPIFYSEIGPYRFVEDEKRFELDLQLWPFDQAGADSLLTLTEDHRGNVWMVFPDSVVKAVPDGNGHYAHEVPEALKFRKTTTSTILVEEDDIVWFNDGDELIRYDPTRDTSDEFIYHSVISKVVQNSDGHAIFNGSFRGPEGGIVLDQPESSILELPYEQRDLTFNVAATTFIYPEAIRFQTRLDGKTDGWSRWSSETKYPVTGIGEGFYTFRVRARDASGRISQEAAYSFVIVPPWYRAWWAFLLYVASASLLLLSVRKYWMMVRAQKLAAEQAEELERERKFSKKLQEANDNLRKANQLKDEFLATTSHELRTPLTAILGFTTILKDEIPEDADYREFLDIIEDSGSRLMETLNSLLDLAKLRAGMMEITLETQDIYHQCCDSVAGFLDTSRRQGLELVVEKPESPLFASVDVHGFSRVMQILVGNALKFTETGSILIRLEAESQTVNVFVRDTGIGIEEKFLPQLFEEFIQESDGPSRVYEGSGVGLAITARLVQLMEGTISVESRKGEGSTFTVRFPRVASPVGDPIRVGHTGQSWEA